MKLSVIIPTYNRAALLVRTLGSVLNQTRPPDEIIVVDDGSTDNTREVVAGYGDRVTYIYQENAYQPAARNTGQAHAAGDCLCFLDSDDLLLPDALAELEKALEAAPEAALAYCLYRRIDENDNYIGGELTEKEPPGDIWRELLHTNILMSTGAALIRRSYLDRTEPWDTALRGVEDWDMFLRLAESAPFVRVEKPLFLYRVHTGNMSGSALIMRRGIAAVYEKHLKRHRSDPERCRHLARARRQFQRDALTANSFEAGSAGQFGKSFWYLFKAALADPRLFAERWVIATLLRSGCKSLRVRT